MNELNVEHIKRIANLLRDELAAGVRPHFQFPPPEYAVSIPIGLVGERCSLNDDARAVIRKLDRELRGDVSVFMLRVSCELLRYPYEIIPLMEFMAGYEVAGISRGGQGGES
jgi:hypothetical protein